MRPPQINEEIAMTLPTRWNPLRQMTRFDPLSDFDELFRGLATRPMSREFERAMEMRLDVIEDDKVYRIKSRCQASRKTTSTSRSKATRSPSTPRSSARRARRSRKELYSERYIGKAYRSFSLPFEVDSTKSEAKYDGGVLMLIAAEEIQLRIEASVRPLNATAPAWRSTRTWPPGGLETEENTMRSNWTPTG